MIFETVQCLCLKQITIVIFFVVKTFKIPSFPLIYFVYIAILMFIKSAIADGHYGSSTIDGYNVSDTVLHTI